jgi:hypothetical protein
LLFPCRCSRDQAVGIVPKGYMAPGNDFSMLSQGIGKCVCYLFFVLFFNQRCLNHIYVCNGVTPRVKSSIDEEPLNNKQKIEWKRKIYKNLV